MLNFGTVLRRDSSKFGFPINSLFLCAGKSLEYPRTSRAYAGGNWFHARDQTEIRRVNCRWLQARDLNLHLDSTYAWIQPIPGFEEADVCDGIPPPLPPFVRHPGLGPVFTRPKRS